GACRLLHLDAFGAPVKPLRPTGGSVGQRAAEVRGAEVWVEAQIRVGGVDGLEVRAAEGRALESGAAAAAGGYRAALREPHGHERCATKVRAAEASTLKVHTEERRAAKVGAAQVRTAEVCGLVLRPSCGIDDGVPLSDDCAPEVEVAQVQRRIGVRHGPAASEDGECGLHLGGRADLEWLCRLC